MSQLSACLDLARVPNVPTVWSGTLTAVVLSGATVALWPTLWMLAGFSLFYIAGSFLKDAGDTEIDRVEHPDRPIPAGHFSRASILKSGYGLTVFALLALGTAHMLAVDEHGSKGIAWLVASLVLALLIMGFKVNRGRRSLLLSLCRVMLIITGSYLLTAVLPPPVLIGAALSLGYLLGITFIVKQEGMASIAQSMPVLLLASPIVFGLLQASSSAWILLPVLLLFGLVCLAVYLVRRGRPPDVPRATKLLVAGICLLDAILIAPYAASSWVLVATGLFLVTIVLQRRIRIS